MNPGNFRRGRFVWFGKVRLLPSLPDNQPALVNMETRVLRLSDKYWRKLPPEWKIYMIYHELGHINNGASEEAAERWAIKNYIKHGYSAKEAVAAHTEVYPFNEVDTHRAKGLVLKSKRALELARIYDFHFNGNSLKTK